MSREFEEAEGVRPRRMQSRLRGKAVEVGLLISASELGSTILLCMLFIKCSLLHAVVP